MGNEQDISVKITLTEIAAMQTLNEMVAIQLNNASDAGSEKISGVLSLLTNTTIPELTTAVNSLTGVIQSAEAIMVKCCYPCAGEGEMKTSGATSVAKKPDEGKEKCCCGGEGGGGNGWKDLAIGIVSNTIGNVLGHWINTGNKPGSIPKIATWGSEALSGMKMRGPAFLAAAKQWGADALNGMKGWGPRFMSTVEELGSAALKGVRGLGSSLFGPAGKTLSGTLQSVAAEGGALESVVADGAVIGTGAELGTGAALTEGAGMFTAAATTLTEVLTGPVGWVALAGTLAYAGKKLYDSAEDMSAQVDEKGNKINWDPNVKKESKTGLIAKRAWDDVKEFGFNVAGEFAMALGGGKGAQNLFGKAVANHKEAASIADHTYGKLPAKNMGGTGSLLNIPGTGAQHGNKAMQIPAPPKATGTKTGITNVYITKVFESLNIHTQNLTESTSQIEAHIAKVLLKAVNDANAGIYS